MDTLNPIAPLQAIPNANDTEAAYQAILNVLFAGDSVLGIGGELKAGVNDLIDYGCPVIGRKAVIERFSKQDGLVAMRQSSTSDALMRVLFTTWQAHGSKRGLNFLEFALQVLFPDLWLIKRLFHSVEHSALYPAFRSDVDDSTTFPTSRIVVQLDHSIDPAIASELAPSLLRLVPAHIVPSISYPPIETEQNIGIATTAYPVRVADYSQFV